MAETFGQKFIRSNLGRVMKHFEGFMVFVGVVGPFATLPQLAKLYLTHSQHASGQSLVTWSLYAALSLLWFAYGLMVKKLPIYVGNGISMVLNLLMVVGILIHAGVTF
ncbi:SemiSWEET transporter [Ruegeria sp. 2012CJ41-6]|uniref:SemiSWEET transporter n=1 Tax=Ruegeria spongiae TaxID=2942209 RepID=A0ABT0Q401_9RHOB|nr:SemiSWEET transporter [Ruegeria spongiae]MCL6284588.1 SemiSWEET transporter [Ruegeria spongiae]